MNESHNTARAGAIGPRTVCVVGLGYIGLPTAAVLASRGHDVHGVEVNKDVVETINTGKTHIVEPDLDMLVQAAVQTGRLKAHLTPSEADVFMICVPTPFTGDHEPDLTYVREATKAIAPHVRPGNLVIVESTIPPGTTDLVASIISEHTGLLPPEIHVAHAPERVLPGKILREVVENDRIVGGVDEASTAACVGFYSTFVQGKILETNATTAECAKLVENAFRDVNIAFANELSIVSDRLGLDVWELIDLANHHPRVNILQPGPGVGGHCIAVDPWFLIHTCPEETRLIKNARQINDYKADWVVDRVARKAERFKQPRIACLGLAYKPDIDDLRESPAVDITRALQERVEGEIRAVEPNISEHPEFNLMGVQEAVEDADIIVILVAHEQFRKLPASLFTEKVVIDTCGILSGEQRSVAAASNTPTEVMA